MPSMRKRKSMNRRCSSAARIRDLDRELLLWDRMPPVGREFGSPDFERLMAEDHREMAGVFDPELKRQFT